jgi:GNAT superfamily N-acetyltransferase
VLESSFAEAWVYDLGRESLGFTVLVTDERGWAMERGLRRAGSLEYLLAVARHPHLIFAEIQRRIRLRIGRFADDAVGLPDRKSYGERTWIELTAVSPHARRRGVARRLNEWCETRTLELGRRLIERNVEPSNRAMRSLCERRGYVYTRGTRVGCTYSKILAVDDAGPEARPD